MIGKLFGVGVGPGDPELMTIKAVRTIDKCDILAIPSRDKDTCTAYNIAKCIVKNIDLKEAVFVHIPMTKDKTELDCAYDEGVKIIENKLLEGKNVAFINLGDPTIYSTYMGIHERVAADGYNAEIINGVTSFCAVAGRLGTALAKSKESIHIYPATYENEDIFHASGTKILMKSGKRLAKIKKELSDMEQNGKIKAYAVTDCTMDSESICRNISELDENAGYFTTVIVKSVE